jgi:hypothetical protein
VVDSVLAAMRRYSKVVDVARYGTKALENFASRDDAKRVEIASKNGVQTIILCAKEHGANAVVQGNAFHALAVLASDGLFGFFSR